MDDEPKKISLPEIIIMLILLAGVYLFGVFADFSSWVPVAGQAILFMSEVADFVVWAIVQFWLIMKGGIGFAKQALVFGGELAQTIPFLNLLPINIATLLIAVYLINNPKIEKAAGLATGKIPK